MAKNNYYAIIFPDNSPEEIVSTWVECQKKIKNISNIKFKGFLEEESAQKWLKKQRTQNQFKPSNSIKAYVDGSFVGGNVYAGWGYILVEHDKIIHKAWGRTPSPALSRNIDGELQATIEAIKWAMTYQKNLVIYHDYMGIECWATGAWKAKSYIALAYQRFLQSISIELAFVKVKGHSGNKYNEMVDLLAKKGLDP